MMRSIRALAREVDEEKEENRAGSKEGITKPETASKETQTEREQAPGPQRAILATPKRRREAEKKRSPVLKKHRITLESDTATTTTDVETEDSEMDVDRTVIYKSPKKKPKSKKAQRRAQTTASEAETGGKKDKMEARKKTMATNRRMLRRAKPDAIVLEKVGEASYADILRRVKNDPNLKEMGEKVARIKRTQKGQMMFELRREEEQRGVKYQDVVEKALGGLATVRVLTQEMSVVCKDMDEITSKEELLRALGNQFGLNSLPESAIRSMRAAYGGTQTAVISLPMEAARKVLSIGRIKIGWTMCRLREFVRPRSCFRCMAYGHLAKDCKGIDRSKMCRRCGEDGHIAKSCEKEPRCRLCEESGERSQHITGSSGCPKYRSAVRKERS
jgi:hypothetical protein